MKRIAIRISIVFVIYLVLFVRMDHLKPAPQGENEVIVEADVEERPTPETEETIPDAETVVVENPLKDHVEIIPNNASDYGILENTVFTLVSTVSLNEKAIREGLLIEPLVDYDITVLTDKTFQIKPINALSKNTIYRFSYAALDYGQAFQTVEALKVLQSYPGKAAKNVPTDSSIEITFNGKNIEGFEDHFSISPHVRGRISHEDGKFIFLSDGFELNKAYRVTISAGITDGERVLAEPFTYEFYTGASSDFNYSENATLLNAIYGEIPIVQLNKNRNSNYNIEILKSNSFNDFKATYGFYQKNKSHDLSFDNYESVYEARQKSFEINGRYYLELPDVLEKGHYVVLVNGSAYKLYVFLHVGEHHIYYSKAENGELIWLINGLTGKAEVGDLYSNEKFIGQTNKEGVLLFESEGNYTLNVGPDWYIVKSKNEDPYFEFYGDRHPPSEYWSFIYTDRSNYQRDDTINVYAFIKSYSDRPIKNLQVALGTYWLEDDLFKKDVELSSDHTITTSLPIKDLDEGYYSLSLIADGQTIDEKFILVNRYEKPEIKLNLSADKSILFSGDLLKLNFSSNYYNGLPYYDFKAKVSYGSWFSDKNHKYIETGNANEIEFEISPIIFESDWHPVDYQIRAQNDQIEDTPLETFEVVTVMPRDVMIQATTSENKKGVTLEIETNNVDISNFTGSFGNNYEKIKGDPIDRKLMVSVTEKYYEKIFVKTIYDKVHKVSRDIYKYNYISNYLGDFKVDSLEGKAEFVFETQKERRYEFVISTEDKSGRLTSETNYYNPSFGNYFYDFRYDFDAENKSYLVGERVKDKILSFGQAIENNDRDIALILIKRNGILDYIVTDKTEVTFKFLKAYRPNILLSAIYYDGVNMNFIPGYGNKVIAYKKEALEVEVKVHADKIDYVPGETVVLTVEVVDQEGKAFNGEANISVVDEAYFALFNDYFNMAEALHRQVYDDGISLQTITSPHLVFMGGAEGGEGGDGSFIRDDFKDTAVFKTIKIIDGKGVVKFNLPDDLTKWRITTQVVNNDLNYGVNKTNINTKLPFFIRTLYDTSYIRGDDIYVSLKSDGDAIDANAPVTYTVAIGDASKVVEGLGKNIVNVPLGQLSVGTYELRTIADFLGLKDGVKENIGVKDTYLIFDHKKTTKITNDFVPMTDGKLSFYNKAARDLELNIFRSYSMNDFRVEEMVARFGAYQLLAQYFGFEYETFGIRDYQTYDGSIRALMTSDGSLPLTALIAGTGYGIEHFDKDKIVNYLRMALTDANTPIDRKAMILWGLAKQDEPVLLSVNKLLERYDFISLDPDTKIYTMNALLDLGEYSRVKALYPTAFTSESVLTYRAYLLLLTINKRLGYEQENFFKGTVQPQDKNDTYNLEKIYNLFYYESDYDDAFLTYKIDGQLASIDLKDTHSIDVDTDGVDFEILEFYGDVYVTEKYKVWGTDYKKYDSAVLAIEKTYRGDHIQPGDIVEVVLNTRKFEKESAIIYDRIPAGFIYAGMKAHKDVYGEVSNKDLKFYIGGQEVVNDFTYYIRATQLGRYTTERAAIQNYYREAVEFSDQTMLEVKGLD